MPEMSRFHGIAMAMFFHDHAPPYFHATNGACDAHRHPGEVERAAASACAGDGAGVGSSAPGRASGELGTRASCNGTAKERAATLTLLWTKGDRA
jgi:hypothetical protein